jgi:hypothetical protein
MSHTGGRSTVSRRQTFKNRSVASIAYVPPEGRFATTLTQAASTIALVIMSLTLLPLNASDLEESL